MYKDLVRVKDKVEFLLTEYESTRDDDKLLWLSYMCYEHNLKNKLGLNAYKQLKQIILNDAPTFESLTRARRKIQENGKLIGNSRTHRMNEQEKVIEWSKGIE